MDIRAGISLTQNTPICETRQRLQRKLKARTHQEFGSSGAFDLEAEKATLESTAQELRREIEILKRKADLWKVQLNM